MTTLLTTQQAADELQVSQTRIRALIKAERLKTTVIGGRHLIKPHDLDAVRVRKNGRPTKE